MQSTAKSMQSTAKSMRRSSVPSSLLITTLLSLINTVKLYHWRTLSYATHKATDELFSNLNDKVDEFVEVLLGKNDTSRTTYLQVDQLTCPIITTSSVFTSYMDDHRAFLTNMAAMFNFDPERDSDLLAIRDELLALLNRYLYLQSLTA
jgi:DNA-binding ferritin-like protein